MLAGQRPSITTDSPTVASWSRRARNSGHCRAGKRTIALRLPRMHLAAGPAVARGAALLRLLRRNVSSGPRSDCGFYPMKASLVAISDAQAYKQ